MRYRIGMLGLGSIGQRMLASIACHDRFEVCAAWDPSARACERARANHGSVRLAADAASLVGDEKVDLVYVACPPAFHREHALSAVEAGKPIFCEKPLGVDLAESRELVSGVEKSGRPNAVNLLFGAARSATVVASAQEQGALGEVVSVELRLHLPRWAARRMAEAPWLNGRAQGGFVREVGTHYVYLCQRLFGPVSVRHVALQFPHDGVGAERYAHVELAAGRIPIVITGTTAGTGPELNECTVWGSKTAYRIRDIHLLDIADGNGWIEAFPAPELPERDTH
ncbi:MAG: Gfo/Idh/MocA family protein, partial [Gammaproteobacteria bacterium]